MSKTHKNNPQTTVQQPEDDENSTNVPKLSDRYADESYKLFQKLQVADPTPEEARKIRNKCLRRILPFLCIGYHLMYIDKQTVGFVAPLSSYYRPANGRAVGKLSNPRNHDRCSSQLQPI
jgi:hypothetical protein